MLDTINLVMGECGEYDDARDWPVHACDREEDADAMVKRLTAWCDEHGFGWMSYNYEKASKHRDKQPPDDTFFASASTTGTRYYVTIIPCSRRKS